MFSIVLYYCKTENNRFDKSNYLQKIASISGTLREETSIINPSITIELTDEIISNLISGNDIVVDDNKEIVNTNNYNRIIVKYRSKVLSSNYLFIPQFARYYFVDNITCVTSTLWRIDCSVDVLMSFKEQLMELDVFCTKNEFNYDRLLPDGSLPATLKPEIKHIYNRGNLAVFPQNTYLYTSIYNTPETAGQNKFFYILTLLDTAHNENEATNMTEMTVPYICSRRNLKDIFDTVLNGNFISNAGLFNVDDPSQNISKISMIPFNILNIFNNDNDYEDIGSIKIGVTSLDIYVKGDQNPNTWYIQGHKDDGEYVVLYPFKRLKNSGQYSKLVASFDLTEYGNDFFNYSGYSKMSIYIPYVGYKEISTDLCCGRYVYVWLMFDIVTPKIMLVIKATDESQDSLPNIHRGYDVLIEELDLIYDIPIGKTNASSKATNALMTSIKTVLGVGLAVATGGIGGGLIAASTALDLASRKPDPNTGRVSRKEGNIIKKRGQIEQVSNAMGASSDVINIATNATIDIIKSLQENTTMSGNLGGAYLEPNNVSQYGNYFILFQRVHITIFDDIEYELKYNHNCGRVSRYNGKLKNLKGYTELGGFHLEGLYNCTLTEQQAINGILRSGFLMPDPD